MLVVLWPRDPVSNDGTVIDRLRIRAVEQNKNRGARSSERKNNDSNNNSSGAAAEWANGSKCKALGRPTIFIQSIPTSQFSIPVR